MEWDDLTRQDQNRDRRPRDLDTVWSEESSIVGRAVSIGIRIDYNTWSLDSHARTVSSRYSYFTWFSLAQAFKEPRELPDLGIICHEEEGNES